MSVQALLDERHGFLSWTSANNLPMCHRLNSSNLESERPLKAKHVSPKSFNLVLVSNPILSPRHVSCVLLRLAHCYILYQAWPAFKHLFINADTHRLSMPHMMHLAL